MTNASICGGFGFTALGYADAAMVADAGKFGSLGSLRANSGAAQLSHASASLAS